MKRLLLTIFLLCAGGGLVLFANRPQPDIIPFVQNDTGDSATPILVELFTSQGCSSCPPADELLRTLSADPKYAGRIVPLSYHVDYWNYLGWRDPFSNEAWTQRQADYVEAMGGATLYTPQIVVHGRVDLVGSKEKALKKAIRTISDDESASNVTLRIASLQRDGEKLHVDVQIETEMKHVEAPYEIVAAIFESGRQTDVPKGENAGRLLKNDFVVRQLSRVNATGASVEPIIIDLLSDWSQNDLGVAVWAQERGSMHVLGVVTQDLIAGR